jgi:hypothetical protein
MRAAYQRSTLPRLGYTYERAMSLPHLAICLRHTGHVVHRQTRTNDTVRCSCGKQWDLNDMTPESCK